MGTITGATVRRSNFQHDVTSNTNLEGGQFSHFKTIGANQFRGFGIFGNNNNPSLENNNNNNSSLGFGRDLGGGFNLPSGGNAGGLDPNVVALVNALIGANLEINHVERELNHVKLIEFGETEAEDPNEWLE